MIIKKFTYDKLERKSSESLGRTYVTPANELLPSVTTILDRTRSLESKLALQQWRKFVGEAKAKEITQEAAFRGTKMHTFLEEYMLTGQFSEPSSNPYTRQSKSMAQIILEQGIVNLSECYGTEVSLYYPELYAGTADLVGLYNGELAIIDFKQTNKLKTDGRVEDYKVQLAAYIEAHDHIHQTEINLGVILMCSKDLQFQTWEIKGSELEKYKIIWWNKVRQYYGLD